MRRFLRFPHRVLKLWELEAEIICGKIPGMDTLLPAMKGANPSLLLQAMDEMSQRYKDAHLARHLWRLRHFCIGRQCYQHRKKQIERAISMYDSLLD